MNVNRTKVKLFDVAEFQNGHAFYKDGYSSNGYLAIDLFNISEDGRLRFADRDKYVSDDVASKYNKFILNQGDLVIVMTDMTQSLGILGRCAFIDKNDYYVLNQRIGRVVPKAELVNPYYLYLYINSDLFRKPLHSLAKGAVQKYVNTGDIKDNLVELPTREIQNKIVEIIKQYNELILNNEKRIHILEEMAQVLYEEWFVHFRFPGHEKVKIVDSELGKIPEGWELKMLDCFIDQRKKSYKPEEYRNMFDKYVGLEHIQPEKLVLTDFADPSVVNSSKSGFMKDDILFGRLRPYLHKVVLTPYDGVASTDILVFTPKLSSYLSYALMTVARKHFIDYVTNAAGGTDRPRARWETIKEYKIAVPMDRALISEFTNIVLPMLRLMQVLVEKNKVLESVRDLLLPKLISGEVEV